MKKYKVIVLDGDKKIFEETTSVGIVSTSTQSFQFMSTFPSLGVATASFCKEAAEGMIDSLYKDFLKFAPPGWDGDKDLFVTSLLKMYKKRYPDKVVEEMSEEAHRCGQYSFKILKEEETK